jgi:RNA polymerase sigma-70 factor (ECF subfamily)
MFSDDLETHLPDLRAYARVLCGDVVRADDIVQNACLKAWENRASFDPQKGALRGWLFRIVRNEFYQQKRAERVRETDPTTQIEHHLVADCGLQTRSELTRMLQAIETLKEAQRDAFLLVAAAGFTYAEAAEVLGCSEGTVKSRVSRARDMALGKFHSDQRFGDKQALKSSPLVQLHEALNRIQALARAA